MLSLVHNMINGKLKGAELYTNGWPEFSAVVCRCEDVLFHQVFCYSYRTGLPGLVYLKRALNYDSTCHIVGNFGDFAENHQIYN